MSSDQPKTINPWKYHTLSDKQAPVINKLRDEFEALAKLLEANIPAGREYALAVTKLEEAAMWANKAALRIE